MAATAVNSGARLDRLPISAGVEGVVTMLAASLLIQAIAVAFFGIETPRRSLEALRPTSRQELGSLVENQKVDGPVQCSPEEPAVVCAKNSCIHGSHGARATACDTSGSSKF